ncbi:hypothetical protein [Haloferax sp. ATB1]|uniref:hypothetical protein n=1 Tax=Haloferax sp. ATB1 TaxID=1508454 RepID=UPI000694BC63|nr:hypothetical protein [Haloferax sp. ATB1]
MSKREQRVTRALKWHYLDNDDVEAIQRRFEETGHGSFAKSTIRKYLNEEPSDEVIRMIEEEHANARLQIAEREERMWQRAREAEDEATEDVPIKRVVPQTKYCSGDQGVFRMPAWEFVDPGDDDWPEWAEEGDVIIRFIAAERTVEPGDEYPLQAFDGSPKFTTEFVGLKRDEPDFDGERAARMEQSQHLQAKGNALGVYKDRVELSGSDGKPIEVTVSRERYEPDE